MISFKDSLQKFFHVAAENKNKVTLIAVILVILIGSIYHFSTSSTLYSYSSNASGPVASAAVGTIEGDFAVTPNGAANYSFAIDVPPGTNGVAPNLSVSYNSQGQNGYLGQGFALGGLSAISRCNYIKNYNQPDFQRIGVDYTYNDHFCLDGDELIVSNGGVYGHDLTEYRTTEETWTKVVSYGVCGKGPCYFIAYNKDGSELQFGKDDDSQIVAQGRSDEDRIVRVWAINKMTDLNNNYTTINYLNNKETGEYYPTSISYTGNDFIGQAPQRFVNFIYEPRDDLIIGYIAGSKVTLSQRLKNIQTSYTPDPTVDPTLVTSYNLDYNYSSTTKGSILHSIEQCDGLGVCFPPTQFDWVNDFVPGEVNVDPYVSNIGEMINDYNIVTSMTLDVNNDGFADVVQVVNSPATEAYLGQDVISSFISDGKGQYKQVFRGPGHTSDGTPVYTFTVGNANKGFFGGDVNGDGSDDLIQIAISDNNTANLVTYLAQENGSFAEAAQEFITTTNSTVNDSSFYASDVNGDGLMDIVQAYRPGGGTYSFISYLAKQNGTFSDAITTNSSLGGDGLMGMFLADVNGDGDADIINTYNEGSKLVIFASLADGLGKFSAPYKTSTGQGNNSVIITAGDVNGDGKDDIIHAWSNNKYLNLLVYISKGDGLFEGGINTDTGQGSGNIGISTGDMNGDGRLDLLQFFNNNGNLAYITYISNGTGSFYNGAAGGLATKADNMSLNLGDINGDGRTDFTQTWSGGSTAEVFGAYIEKGTPPNQMVHITDGIGGETAISYATLSSAVNYVRGGGAVYPVEAVKSPMNVVLQYSACDGSVTCDGVTSSPNQYIYSYEYGGAKYDTQRNMWLGFLTFKTNDIANNRYTIGTYNQTYPANGDLTKSEVCSMEPITGSAPCSSGGGSLMSATITNYINSSSAADQALGINQIVPSNSSFSIYTLGENTPSTIMAKNYLYDAYGNLSMVADLGNVDASGKSIIDENNYPIYSCSIYSNNIVKWQLGYVLQTKQERSLEGCTTFLDGAADMTSISWNPETDLAWIQNTYDDNMNEASLSTYDDSNDVFLTSYTKYDKSGNIIGTITPAGTPNVDPDALCDTNPTQTCITYDSIYHTFPIKTESAVTENEERLTSWKSFEPAYGQVISVTSSNGTSADEEAFTSFYEVDGFGRLVNTYGPNLEGIKTLLSTNRLAPVNPTGFTNKTFLRPDWDATSDQGTWYWEDNYSDGMGREYLQRQVGLNSEGAADPIAKATSFSKQGNVDGETAAYFQSSNPDNSLPDNWEMWCNPNSSDDSATNVKNWARVNYDIYNQATCNTNPDGVQERTDYSYVPDINMNLLQINKIQASGTGESTTKSTVMNAQQMIIKKVYPNGDIQYYKYDAMGNLIAMTLNSSYSESSCVAPLAKGTVCFTYDSMARKRSQTSSDSGTETYHYNAVGRLTSTVDAGGNEILYTAYDNLDRLLSKTSNFTDFSGETHSQIDNFTYDVASGAVNASGSLAYLEGVDGDGNMIYNYTFSYDSYGNAVQNMTNVAALGSDPLIYSRGYDPMGRVVSYTYPDGSVQKVNYKLDDNVSNITLCDSATGVDCLDEEDSKIYASYSHYDANGFAQNIAYSNNEEKNIINITNQYYPSEGGTAPSSEFIGPSYAIKSITANSTNAANPNLFSRQYNWSRLNDITSITDLLTSPIGDQDFSYNDQPENKGMEFLTGARGEYGTYKYDYDSVGNITSKTDGDADISYTYNDKTNQIATGSDGDSFEYYDNGNLKQQNKAQEGWNYSYNTEGKVTHIHNSGSNIDEYYTYDGMGNNIIRKIVSAEKTSTIYYLAPSYEINDLGSSTIYTKYLTNSEGVIAAITSPDSDVSSHALSSFNYHNNTAKLLGIRDDFTSQVTSIFHKLSAFASHPEIRHVTTSTIFYVIALISLMLLAYLIFTKAKNKTDFATKHKNQVLAIPFLIFFLCITHTNISYATMIPGENGEGVPVAGTTRFFIKDQLGSIVGVTDQNGLTVAKVNYLPYGAIDQANSNGINDFRPKFLGNEWNITASLYNFGDRFYDPAIGRFTSPDPATQYFSPYLYTGDNPLSYIDEDGDFAFIIMAIVVIVALSGAYAGGMAMNGGNPNPAQWDWNDGMTYAGIFGGAAIGLAGAGAGAAIGMTYGVAAGTAAAVVLGAGENASYSAMGGGSIKDIGIAAGEGAAFSLAFEMGGAAMGSVASRFARQGATDAANDAGRSLEVEMVPMGEAADTCSFVSGTKVKTPSGMKNIELVKAGEKIFSYNFSHKQNDFYEVLQTHSRQARALIIINTAKGDKIKVTAEHPFWIANKNRFIAAGKLKTSDLLIDSEKNPIKIIAIEKSYYPKKVRVYNFSVDKTENFYVSDNKILSHNCSVTRASSKAQKKPTRTTSQPKRYASDPKYSNATSTSPVPPQRPSFRKGIREEIANKNNNLCKLNGTGCAGNGKAIGIDDVYQSSGSGSDLKIGHLDHITPWNKIKAQNGFRPKYNSATGRWKWSREAIDAYNDRNNLQWTCYHCNTSKGDKVL